MAVNEKIRIKIKGYEHAVVDAAASKIVEAAKRSGARVSGPIPLPTDKEIVTCIRIAVSSLSREHTKDLLMLSDQLLRQQMHCKTLKFQQV